MANLYMRRFILGWKTLGHQQRLGAYIVNYADDYVICCRGTAQEAMAVMQTMMGKLKLTVNEAKTTICSIPEGRFDFLGYTIGRCYSPQTGRAYIGTSPSKKATKRINEAISEETRRRWLPKDPQDLVAQLNRKLVGWGNYFCLGQVSKAYRKVDTHARERLRRWLRNKHKVPGKGTSRFPDKVLYETLGLIRLEVQTRNLPWANA